MRNHSSFLFLGYASVFKGRAKTIGLKTIGPHVSPNYATKGIIESSAQFIILAFAMTLLASNLHQLLYM